MNLGFATRIVFIVVTGFMALVTGLIVLQYLKRGQGTDDGPRLPLPDQIVSMVQLLEKSSPDDRRLLLRAFSSATTRVFVQPDSPVVRRRFRMFRIERPINRYLTEFGGRHVRVYGDMRRRTGDQAGKGPILGVGFTVTIRLNTGEYLVLDTLDVLNTRVFGVPPGFWAGFFGFLIAAFVMIAMWREIGPLRRLSEAVREFSLNAKPVSVEEKGARELRLLTRTFNQMQKRIDVLMRSRVMMLSAISHDIRTCLTRMWLRVEKTEDPVRDALISDIEDMTRLIDDALELARATTRNMELSRVDIAAVVRSECGKAEVENGDVGILFDAPEEVAVLADELSLRRVLSNILDNARKYGKRAEVNLEVGEKTVAVIVDDRGPGIPPEMRDIVMEPFQRMESSRNRETGGAGLGLAIANELLVQNSGSLTISDSPRGGARLIIELGRYLEE